MPLHRTVGGVEPICAVLPIAPSTYNEHRARRLDPEKRPQRAKSEERLRAHRADLAFDALEQALHAWPSAGLCERHSPSLVASRRTPAGDAYDSALAEKFWPLPRRLLSADLCRPVGRVWLFSGT